MNLDKFTKIYIVTSSIVVVIAAVGIIFGFGYKMRCRENNDSTEVKAESYSEDNNESTEVKTESYSEGNKTYTIDLNKTDAVLVFSTILANPFTGSKGGDVVSYNLYYDDNFNVYYRGRNSVYVPYLKDDGSQYKWNIEKGEIE